MPSVEHVEKHFTATAAVRDIVIGMADGLTVPFALAAGHHRSGGVHELDKIVVTAGLAEIAAGSIAMGLGGYLAAKTDTEHYASELDREYRETVELPEIETEEVAKVFRDYGLTEEQMTPMVSAITADQKKWVDFMMRFELGLEQPDPARAARSAVTIAAAYIAGGFVPLAPYMLIHQDVQHGANVFRGRDVAGAFHIWRGQRAFHWREAAARRNANRDGRRLGCRGGILSSRDSSVSIDRLASPVRGATKNKHPAGTLVAISFLAELPDCRTARD